MRWGWLAVGGVLLLLAAALIFVPMSTTAMSFPSSDVSGNYGGVSTFYEVITPSSSLLQGTPIYLSWTTSASLIFYAMTCSHAVTSGELSEELRGSFYGYGPAYSSCGTNATYGPLHTGGWAYSNGTGGAFSLTVPLTGSLVLFAYSVGTDTVLVILTATQPIIGLALVGTGGGFTVTAVVMKIRSPRPRSPSTMSMQAGPAAAPSEPESHSP